MWVQSRLVEDRLLVLTVRKGTALATSDLELMIEDNIHTTVNTICCSYSTSSYSVVSSSYSTRGISFLYTLYIN
jgi:hypothetical protein